MKVIVPATSANLGPGFDALGLALGLFDEVEVSLSDAGLTVEITGEGAGEVPRDESHLVVRAFLAAVDGPMPGLTLRCHNRIPHGRGLGSSAAAICAGILAARALVAPDLSDDEVFALATALEGHPDNVAACLGGGLTIAWTDAAKPYKTHLRVHPDIAPVVCVPRQRLATDEARRLLPKDVPHSDAAANAARAALLVAAMTVDPGLLLPATEDRLHQNYRAPAMPASADLVRRLRGQGVAAVISGAGPTVLALVASNSVDSIAPEVGNDWHIQPLNVDRDGARVQYPETR